MSSTVLERTAAIADAHWRLLWRHVLSLIRHRLRQRREYRELIEYLASDRRAAADLGITLAGVRGWPSVQQRLR